MNDAELLNLLILALTPTMTVVIKLDFSFVTILQKSTQHVAEHFQMEQDYSHLRFIQIHTRPWPIASILSHKQMELVSTSPLQQSI